MIHKKIILGLFLLVALGACGPTAMLGPVYTLTSTGSVTQAGLSYGSSELISKHTGKTPIENIIEISQITDDAIEDAILMGADPNQVIEIIIQSLKEKNTET